MRRQATTLLAAAISFGLMWAFLRGPWGNADGIDRPPALEVPTQEDASAPPLDPLGLDASPSELVLPSGPESAAPESAPGAASGSRTPTPSGPSLVRGNVTVRGAVPLPEPTYVFGTDASGRTPSVRVDGDGRFLFADVAPGKFHIRTFPLGVQPGRASVEVEPGGIHTVELELEAATLIRIRAGDSSGEPLRDVVPRALGQRLRVSIIATEERPLEVLDPPFAGGSNPYGIGSHWGAMQLRLDPPTAKDAFGILVADQPPPFYASIVVGQTVIQTKRVGPGQDELAFTIDDSDLAGSECSATLRVLDASSGEPLPSRASIRRPFQPSWSTATDTGPNGRIELGNLWPGPATLRVEAEGRATVEIPIDLRPRESLQLGDVVMDVPISLSGRIEDPGGSPLALSIGCQLLGDSLQPTRSWRGESDAAGAFRFEDLPRGRYALHVRGDDEGRVPYAARTVWTSTVRIVDARGAAPGPIVLVAESPTEVAVDLTSIARGTRLAVVDAAGATHRRLRVDRDVWALKLPQGPMTLVMDPAQGETARRISFQVTGESLHLDPAR